MTNLYASFKTAQKNPHAQLIFTKTASYTFAEIDAQSAQFANHLIQLGVKPGDRVAVQVEKSMQNVCLYLACLRAGIIFLPLNNTYTEEELSYFFCDATPRLIVCDSAAWQKISSIKNAECLAVKTLDENGLGSLTDNISQAPTFFETHPSYDDDIAVILYTSGTTGKPKGAMITHGGLYHNAKDLVNIWDMKASDTLLHMLPFFHVHGLFFAFHTALLAQSKILLLPKFDLDDFFTYVPASTIFMGVPTHYMRLLHDARLTKKNCAHMRVFISGSAPLLPATFDAFKAKTQHTLLERYGMTETGINASNPLCGERKVGTVGLSLPGVEIRVVDDQNQVLPIKTPGHIQIKGKNLFKGYWRKPEKTKEDFTVEGYFKTGDLGMFDEAGYLSIVGRSKDMIITGGLNVYPKEIELTLDALEGVVESAVIGLPHEDFGEAVAAVIATKKSYTEEEIVAYVKQHHAGYKCPKKVFFVEALPKNTMGKVQKNILRERFKVPSDQNHPH